MAENPTIVRWPTSTDYTQAVQRPATAFAEPSLKVGVVALTPLGMPAVASGQNVVVFKMDTTSGQRAIRCFINPPGQGDQRYAALAQYVATHGCKALSGATWIDQGVMAKSRWWPVVIMPWESGRPLNSITEDLLERPEDLCQLAQNWIEAVQELQSAGIAHGDLQHGNVLVNEDLSVRFVDLDGVWVPNQTTGPPAENGHPNYQHPARAQNDWGRHVDSFSALLVYLSLLGLAADPTLERFMGGENLVLVRSDLQQPGSTAAWKALLASPDAHVRDLTTRLINACRLQTPPLVTLSSLLSGNGALLDETVMRAPGTPGPKPLPTPVSAADWWSDPKVAAAGGATVHDATPTPVPSGAPLITGAPAIAARVAPLASATKRAAGNSLAPSAVAGTSTAPSVRRGVFSLLARNAPVSGLVGGAFAGYLGSGGHFLVQGALPERLKSAPLVVLVGMFLGAVLNGWQSIAVRGFVEALPRILLGAAVGAAAGLVALVPADALRTAMLKQGATKSIGLVMLVWMFAAALVGLSVGMLRSGRAAAAGLWGGIVGGGIGGLLHGATTAKFNDHGRLLLSQSPWATTLITVAVASLIGLCIGLVSRVMRRGSLTIIEGRMKGLEVLVDRAVATIGSGTKSTLTIGTDDRSIVATHVALALHEDGTTTAVLAGPTTINGERIVGTESQPVSRELANGSVLQVGQSFIRFDRQGK